MKNKKIIGAILLVLSLASVPAFSSAQEEDKFINISLGGVNESAGARCFDYYEFGSVKIFLHAGKNSYQTGETVKFSGTLNNENDYPISNGNLYIQILRENGQERLKYGNSLIDEKFAVENIYLDPQSQKEVNFEWKIPAGMSDGKYALASFFTVAKKMNVSGLSFIDNVYGGITYFDIKNISGVSEVAVDRTKTTLNGAPFYARMFTPQFERGKEIKIAYPVDNLSGNAQDLKVTEKIYKWDNLLESQMVGEKTENENLAAKGTKERLASYANLEPGIYLFEAKIENAGSQSILKVRFAVSGDTSSGRINFAGISNFPLEKGQSAHIFTCFHSTSDGTSTSGKVTLNLKSGNKVIASADYSGSVTPQIMAINKDFVSQDDYSDLKLETIFYDQDGNIYDRVELDYSCSNFLDVKKINIKIKNETLSVVPVNACGKPVKTKLAIEMTEGGNLKAVLYEASFTGDTYSKKFDFKSGSNYKILAIAQNGVKGEMTYNTDLAQEAEKSEKLGKSLLWTAIIAVVLITIFVGTYFRNRKRKFLPPGY